MKKLESFKGKKQGVLPKRLCGNLCRVETLRDSKQGNPKTTIGVGEGRPLGQGRGGGRRNGAIRGGKKKITENQKRKTPTPKKQKCLKVGQGAGGDGTGESGARAERRIHQGGRERNDFEKGRCHEVGAWKVQRSGRRSCLGQANLLPAGILKKKVGKPWGKARERSNWEIQIPRLKIRTAPAGEGQGATKNTRLVFSGRTVRILKKRGGGKTLGVGQGGVSKGENLRDAGTDIYQMETENNRADSRAG